MIESTQLLSIFAFGLVISGIVGMGVMRAREFQTRTRRHPERDD